jgi:NADH:ubiquinone oxidoreductase subunit C
VTLGGATETDSDHRPTSEAGGGTSRAPGRPGQEVVFVTRDTYVEAVSAYRDGGFEMCSDLCAVDYLAFPGRSVPDGVVAERFEVVVNLLSLSQARRVLP